MKKLSIICLGFTIIMCIAACTDNSQSKASSPIQSKDESETWNIENSQAVDSKNEEYKFLSISLSGIINGSPVEKTFTDQVEIDRIANLIIDQKKLEDIGGLEIPENVIVATIQDGPGTSFKLTLFPATIPALKKEVLVIQGEVFTFYTNIKAYEDIVEETSVIAQEKKSVAIVNDSGDIVVEIFSKYPVDSVMLDECAAEVLESQNKVESGEVSVSYPDNVPTSLASEQAMPHVIEINDANTGDTLAYVSVTKQAEQSVLTKILSKIVRAQEINK